jgi:hypothetical protein
MSNPRHEPGRLYGVPPAEPPQVTVAGHQPHNLAQLNQYVDQLLGIAAEAKIGQLHRHDLLITNNRVQQLGGEWFTFARQHKIGETLLGIPPAVAVTSDDNPAAALEHAVERFAGLIRRAGDGGSVGPQELSAVLATVGQACDLVLADEEPPA